MGLEQGTCQRSQDAPYDKNVGNLRNQGREGFGRNRRNSVTTTVTVSLEAPSVTPGVTPSQCYRRPMRLASLSLVLSLASVVGLTGCASRNEGFRPPATATHAEAKQGEGDLTAARLATGAAAPNGVAAEQTGLATWYGAAFAGKKTASGERFDPSKYTAAHRKLPFGTWVEVRRADTGRTVRVRINDRGPWGDDRRIIDLSRKAAEDLDILREGKSRVELRVVDGP